MTRLTCGGKLLFLSNTFITIITLFHQERPQTFGAFPVNNKNDFRPNHRIGCAILNDLGHRITSVSADDKEAQFLFLALQRFNAILLHESFESDVDPDL